MLFVYESKRRYLAGEPRLRVLSGPEVEHKLKTHRLDEMLSLYKPVSGIAFSGALLANGGGGGRGGQTFNTTKARPLPEEEPALVTAVTLSTHVWKPVLNLNAYAQ